MLVDARGETCPFPALLAKRAMEKHSGEETIIVLTDCAPALETIPAVAARQGFRAEIEKVKEGEWKVLLSRNDGGRKGRQA